MRIRVCIDDGLIFPYKPPRSEGAGQAGVHQFTTREAAEAGCEPGCRVDGKQLRRRRSFVRSYAEWSLLADTRRNERARRGWPP
jgi:hypothetical protein